MPDMVIEETTVTEIRDETLPRGHKDYQIPEPEKALTKTLKTQIENRLKSDVHKQFLKDIETNRTYVRGEQNKVDEEEEEKVVRANLIHPELKKALNECYAKNPELDISPKESVDKSRYETWKAVGKTLELVLNHEFAPDNANLKSKAKRGVRSADTTGFGWLKVIFQRNMTTDPIVVKRMDDIQDNIKTIERLIKETTDQEGLEEKAGELESKKEELNQQLNSLEEKKEVVRSKGLSFALRPSENIVFSDEVCDVEDIPRAEWITDLIWMRESKVKERFGFAPKEGTRFFEKTMDPDAFAKQKDRDTDKGDEDKLMLVYEMWRSSDKRIYTMCAGYEGYLRDPYTPRKVGERFHGFFPLCFDETDGTPYPLALVTQLRSMQDEHVTTRSNFREHREKAVPFNVAHGGDLDPNDTDKLTNPGFLETVVLKSAPQGQPLEAVFKAVQHPPIDPAVYSTEHIRQDWEQVTRRGDAARGTIGRSKTATEADILQTNLNIDTSERRDVVEDWFRAVAKYSAELVLQEYNEAEVRRIAGEGARWPVMSKQEVFDMVDLNVRVGSSGKPNAAQEMERWLKMLPQFRESLLAIMEMRANKQDQQADVLTFLLRETIERFEERIDLDALLPKEEEGVTEQEIMAMKQQQAQIALQMREMLPNIANTDADTKKKLAEAESKEVGPQLQLYTTILQGMLNNIQQQPTGSVQ